ncbi:MAG: signal peptidase II [Chloroflexi bacterium]|nr:signal peptidase II [Chloroflexota bacterium]
MEKITISPNLQHLSNLNPKKSPALPVILGIAALVFALDQATKYWVVQRIPLNSSWSFFPKLAKIFQFTFVTNTGAAFGMFPQLGGIFMVIAIVVIASIVIFYRHLPTYNTWVRLSLGLQLGGALGNLLDRITRGYVVDFVDIGFWPIFNVADLSIVLGVTILAYYLWNEEHTVEQVEKVPNLSEGGNV